MSGDVFDFEECSRATGLRSAETWLKKLELPDLPEAEWSIKRQRHCGNTNDPMRALLDAVDKSKSSVMRFARDHDLQISFHYGITIPESRPQYHFSADTMRRIAAFHAGLDLDIFDYSEDPPMPIDWATLSEEEVFEAESGPPQISARLTTVGDPELMESLCRCFGIGAVGHPRPRRHNGGGSGSTWVLTVPNVASYSTDDASRSLLDRIGDSLAPISSFMREGGLVPTLWLGVTIYRDRPIYEWLERTVRQISDLGAALHLEAADYSDNPETVLEDGTVVQRII